MTGESIVPLATATAETFEPSVGTAFSVTVPVFFQETGEVEERTLALTLAEVRRSRGDTGRRMTTETSRSPFALTFVGPADVALAQHIYGLQHPEMGQLGIFLVPVGIDATGRLYEAVFS